MSHSFLHDTARLRPPLVMLTGEVTVAAAAALHAELQAATETGTDVIVSAAGVTHVDTSVLQLLIAARATLGKIGRRLWLTEIPDPVRDTFRLTGLGELLTETDSPATGARAAS
jgi:anti-anti-sigma factor